MLFYVPNFITLFNFSGVAHLYCISLFSRASPSFSLSDREGAVLHLRTDFHNYHIGCISLLNTCGEFYFSSLVEKRGLRFASLPIRGRFIGGRLLQLPYLNILKPYPASMILQTDIPFFRHTIAGCILPFTD